MDEVEIARYLSQDKPASLRSLNLRVQELLQEKPPRADGNLVLAVSLQMSLPVLSKMAGLDPL